MKLSKRLSRKWFRLDRLISNIKQDVPIHADGELYSAPVIPMLNSSRSRVLQAEPPSLASVSYTHLRAQRDS